MGIEVKACTRLTTLCLRLHRQIDAICTDFENAISTDFEKAFDKVPSLRSVQKTKQKSEITQYVFHSFDDQTRTSIHTETEVAAA